MNSREILDGVLDRLLAHARAWRASAQRIHDKPVHERKEGDQRLITQLKALALQAEQIASWAATQGEPGPDLDVTPESVKPAGLLLHTEGGFQFGDHNVQTNHFGPDPS